MLTRAQIRRRIEKTTAFFFRSFLKNKDFSIISNNCWGGTVYDKYGLLYTSPTVGMWITPEDYLRFLGNLNFYLSEDIKQIGYEESHAKDLLIEKKNSGRYEGDLDDIIIGRIRDVDIVFVHNRDFADAAEKWTRRARRVNFDNLLVKMNDQNGCTKEDYERFMALPFANKLFFTADASLKGRENTVFFKKYTADGYVVSDTKIGAVPMNVTRFLNSMKR